MAETRDPIGISSIGIPSIVPTMGSSPRLTRRKSEDDRDPDHGRREFDDTSLSPPAPGTGTVVDKAV